MSRKFRLFASVAAPLVSLPLMIQPASAAPPKPAIEAGRMPGLIEVQQQLILPDGQGGEGEGRERRPRREQGEGQGQGGGERQQRRQQADQDQGGGERPQRRQQADQDQGGGERPQRRQQAEQGEGGGERQQRRQQADQDQGGGERPQRRQQAEQGEGGAERLLRRQQQTDQEQGGREREQRRERQREQAAPEAEQPATREAERPREAAPEGGERQQRRNAQERREAPAENQAETPAQRPRAADRAATPQTAPEAPARRNAEGEERSRDTGTAQDDRRRQPPAEGRATQDGERQGEEPRRRATEGQEPQPVPGQPTREQATEGRPSREQQTREQQTREQARPPRTPEEVERAREVARDPASARDGEQVVLPVENGAAVLDSAKEEPSARLTGDRERPRRQQTEQVEQQPAERPRSDAEAQANTRLSREQQEQVRAMIDERGERLDGRPQFDRPRGWEFREEVRRDRDRDRDRDGARTIISIDNQTFVRHDDSRRFYVDGREPEYERLRDGRVREIVVRDDGTRVVTVRNRYGEIVQRSRIVDGGDEYVLYYAPELMDERRDRDYVWRDPGADLPPMRLTVPVEDYIIDTSSEPDRDYYEFLEQPPVEQVERVYSLDEVRYSARIRDKVPRIDLDTITFETGSAEIPMDQARSLRKVADAINKVLDGDPSETFLIEGHTDAVGGDEDNLILSDERAESVARVLTDAFNVPPENLATQGYGERYLKVRTDGPEQENRRVTVRRITPLVKPVASKQ
ncbi:OmpA family protein [Neorhizobium sp. DT-125]|uniref:OmpA family protein n=1 Tax=Neorhizobium sp. DT-125 TaxID=3396163 RepID=UPI003F1B16FE